MPFPDQPKRYDEKDLVDRSIDEFSGLDEPTQGDLNKVAVSADIQAKLNAYRARSKSMTPDELETEVHQSSRLAEFLGERPHARCHAHAIVSGGHPEAALSRAALAWLGMRIDDPHNGCWLPENTSAVREMPQWLKKAVPHSRIHRRGYYLWLNGIINLARLKNLPDLVAALRQVEARLQASMMPSDVMLSAEQLRKLGKHP